MKNLKSIITIKNLIITNSLLLLGLFIMAISFLFYGFSNPNNLGAISSSYAKITQNSDRQTIEDAKDRQPIGKLLNKNGKDLTYGTAFIIDDHTLLTNTHVVVGNTKNLTFIPQMKDNETDKYPHISINNKHTINGKDLAVVTTDQSLTKYGHYELGTESPSWFDKTQTIGYPTLPDSAMSEFRMHKTTFRFLFHRNGKFYVAGTIYPGASGSPMFNYKGQVYGVASFRFTHNKEHISGGYMLSDADINQIHVFSK